MGKRHIWPLLAASLAVLAACGEQESAERFTARLDPLNGSGVQGTAEFVRNGDHLTVSIEATGLRGDRIHGQAIYRPAGSPAQCPSGNGGGDDAKIGAEEARSAYGEPVFRLAPFPTVGRDGRLDYDFTFDLGEQDLGSLADAAVVLRGVDPEGRPYAPDLPAACGRLRRA